MSCPREAELEAVASGQRTDLASHLGTCTRCSGRVRELKRIRTLLGSLEPLEVSELEWRRIDKHVIEAMSRAPSRPSISEFFERLPMRFVVPGIGLAMTAAVVLLTIYGPRRPVVSHELAGTQPHPVLPERAAKPALALAVGGDARSAHSPAVLEGDELSTGAGSLEVQTAPATGIQLAPHSQAKATRLRDGETEFLLGSGELLAEVKPLQAGQEFRVRSGDLTVHVVGTAFLVGRTEHAVRVAVVHGRVRVDRAGQADEVFVSGGTEITVADTQPLGEVQVNPMESALAERFPLGFPDMPLEQVQAQFHPAAIDSEPQGARTRLDGAERGLTPLTVLAEVGSHEVSVSLPGHAAQKAQLRVDATPSRTQLTLQPVVPVEDVQAPTPAPTPSANANKRSRHSVATSASNSAVAPTPTPTPEPPAAAKSAPTSAPQEAPAPAQVSFQEAFHTAAVSHQAEVQRCFEAGDASYERRIHLVLNIQPTGRIAPPVDAEEPGVDQAFMDCVTAVARSWEFPAPGRSYEISIPYDVRPKR
jgi:ferric-dicitrate binding protein FerR (iron transport regulator)